jgi:uncharacterized protein YheU (UPF0270 family)
MLIPHTALEAATLDSLVEEFVTREGTDYGTQTFSLADKVAQVRRQLERGEAFIVFDADTSSCHIISKSELPALPVQGEETE